MEFIFISWLHLPCHRPQKANRMASRSMPLSSSLVQAVNKAYSYLDENDACDAQAGWKGFDWLIGLR
eukprot:scaffold114_cov361-Pinguiococcus_pyrenoidosus.AAC.40